MDYQAALAALRKLTAEGVDVAALVAVVEAHVAAKEDKIYQTIGESRTKGSKAKTYEDALAAIAKSLGIEGELDSNLSQIETKLKESVDGFKTTQTKITELEAAKTAAEGKVKGLERETKLGAIAAKLGTDAKALARLLGDKVDELTLVEDTVNLGDKPFKDYVDGDAELKPFAAVLFPTTTPPEGKQPPNRTLPGGNPKGGEDAPADPVKAYSAKRYTGLSAILKPTTED
jgi:hypothetical protein